MKIHTIENVNYIISNSEKFKTSRISFKFALPATKEIIANTNVLSDLIVMSCESYPTIKLLNNKLDEMFDAKINTNVSQKGKLVVLELNINFLSEIYLPNDISVDIVNLINELIFKPNLSNTEYLENVKNKCILEIETIYDDKLKYAFKRMQEHLDNDVLLDMNSNVESIKNVTTSSVMSMYSQFLNEAAITILVDGVNADELFELMKHNLQFSNKSSEFEYYNSFSTDERDDFIVEVQNLKQSKFVIGTKLYIQPKDFRKFQVFNAIYGGYSFSRLFSNIREKKSLAYFVSSGYNPALNIMYIYGGIDNGDIESTDEVVVEEVFKALQFELDSIIAHKISDLEFSQAKSMILNSYKTGLDTQGALQEMQYNAFLGNKNFDLNEFMAELDLVTKDDVSRMAKLVKFNVKFLLRGDE